MVEPRPLQEYIGFTEKEVAGLCKKHDINFEELKSWYDGYHVGDEHLFPNSVEMVVSGINDGINLGDDIVFSGTVAAALMGYLRDLPSIAFSMPYRSPQYLPYATDFAALICKDVLEGKIPRDILLNINYPQRIPSEVKGVKIVKPGTKQGVLIGKSKKWYLM